MKYYREYALVFVAVTVWMIAVSAEVQAGEYYRWTDKDGTVHYGERLPADQEGEQMDLHYGKPSDDAIEQMEKTTSDNKTEKEQQELKRKEQEQALKKAQVRQQNCANARENIRALSRNTSIRFKQEDGSLRRYSEQEHKAQMDRARQLEKESCQGD